MFNSDKECKWFVVCPMKRFYKQGRIPKHWVDNYCHGNWLDCVRYQMEEEGKYHPDWMLPDGSLNPSLKN